MNISRLRLRNFALFILPVFMLFALPVAAQQTTFRINYDIASLDLPGGIVQAANGNVVFAGTNTSFIPLYGTVTEVNSVGQVVWSKGYTSSIATEITDIKRVSSGGYIVTGSTDPGLLIMRLDAAGTVTWAYRYRVTNATGEYGNRITPTSDGGFVVAGGVRQADPDGGGALARQDSSNFFALKVDASGTLLWGNVYFPTTAYNNDHALTDVAEVGDGYIFTGYMAEAAGDPQSNDAVLLKTNTAGVLQWANRYGGSTADGIKALSTTEVLVTGEDGGRPYYTRVSSSGVVSAGSRYSFGFLGLDQGFGTDVIQTNDGNYAMFGTYVGFNIPPVFSAFLAKINPATGALIFQKYYSPTSTSFLSVSLLPEGIQAADSSYMMISTGFGAGTGAGLYDYELIKADKNGLLNNTGCPEANLSMTRASYTPAGTAFTPLVLSTVSRSSVTVAAVTITPNDSVSCRTVVCNNPAAATNVSATNNNFCQGLSTTINASGPATNVTYRVYSAATNGTLLGTIPYTVTPTGTTTYYVETEDNSNPLCVSTTRTAITITVLPGTPAPPASITGPNPACPGANTYTAATSTNATTYTWSVSGGGGIASGQGTANASINWTAAGTYTVSVTAGNSCGTSAPRTLVVTVSNPAPAQPGVITGSITPCPGSQTYTIAAVTNATSYTWTVSGGGTITGSGTSATVNWTTSGGPYTISVTATNGCGTSTARTLQVNVQPGPPTATGTITGNTNVCVGNQGYAVSSVAGATTYTWSVSSGGNITGGQGTQNVIINWTTAGTHTISVTASNGCGSTNATPLTVTVAGAPPATPGAITGTNNACTGNQTYTIAAVAGADTYQWSISGGGTVISGATSTTFTVNWTTSGTHTVSVTASNACGTSSASTLQVTVSAAVPPTPGPITGNTTVCAGSQGYSIAAVAGASGYTWSVSGGGTITAGQNTTSITVNWTTPGGPYTVSVIPTNTCGNGSSSDLQVTVQPGNPTPPASITGSTPVCFGTQSYTAAAVAGATGYTWSVNGGGTIASGQGTATAGINWTTAGTWTVSVTADNLCGNSTPTTLTVEVLPASPPAPGTITGATPACPATSQTYSISAVTGAADYTWSVSGGGTITTGQGTTSIGIDWATQGTWTISVTSNNICGSSAATTYSVTILPSNPGAAGPITGTLNACPGAETYSITAMPDASNYAWTVSGGGTILSGQGTNSISVDWTTSGGPYTVEVTPSNLCGTGTASQIQVTVLDATPPAVDSITGPTPVCIGTSSYTASAVAGATGYTWSVSGGGTVATGQGSSTAGIDWTATGNWVVSVTAQNQCGSSTPTTYNVEVLPADPGTPGNIVGPTGVCPGVQTYSITPLPGATTYTWTVASGGTIISGQGTDSIEVDWASVSGTYTVQVVAGNLCGSGQPSALQVDITPGPPTGTPVIAGNNNPCPGTTSYSVSGVTGAGNYTWTLSGGGTIQSGQGTGSVTIDWTTTGGPYTLEVTPDNTCGTGTTGSYSVTVNGPPVIGAATISGDTLVCPSSESYTITSVAGATGYNWTVSGGGTITSGQGTATVSINWTTSGGPYTLSATATNACGSSTATTLNVTVQPGAPATPGSITGPISMCEGGTDNYSVGAVTNATSYTWSISSGGAVTAGQGTPNATINWTGAPGNYTVSVTATNSCGTSQASTLTVTILPGAPSQPGAISGRVSLCPGTEPYSVAGVANATGYNWALSGGGTIATGQGSNSITVNWTSSGTYQVSVTANNTCGSSTAQTLSVTVLTSPTAPTVTTSSSTICEGDSAILTATGSTGGSTINYNIYEQQTGGSSIGLSPLTVSPVNTTTYYVEVVNESGCTYIGGRVPVTVTVSPAPAAPVIEGTDHGVCYNESTTITASSNGANITWWNAATGGTQLGSGNDYVTGNLTSTTNYYAQATNANGCSSLTGREEVTVTVSQLPVATLTSDKPNHTIFINEALTVTVEPDNYDWYVFLRNGVEVQADSINTWASSSLSNGDTISVIVTEGGCVGEEVEITVIVSDLPNVFTPNGDERNDWFMKGFDLTIINRWGQELYKGMDGWNGTFNGEKVSAGTYFYIVRVPDITTTEKVLTGSVMVHY